MKEYQKVKVLAKKTDSDKVYACSIKTLDTPGACHF